MFYAVFAVIVFLFHSSCLVEADLPGYSCSPLQDDFSYCTVEYISSIFNILQKGERPDIVDMNPYVVPPFSFQSGVANFSLTNPSVFLAPIIGVSNSLKGQHFLEIELFNPSVTITSEYTVRTQINGEPLVASGHCVGTLVNVNYKFLTKHLKKFIGLKNVIQISTGTHEVTSKSVFLGLVNIFSEKRHLTFGEKQELRQQFSDGSESFQREIYKNADYFMHVVGNKILEELQIQ